MTQANHASVSQARPLNHYERRVLVAIVERPGTSRSGICTRGKLSVKKVGKALATLLERSLIEEREVPEPGYETVARRYWVVVR